MNNQIYRIEVEVAPMEGTQLPSDWIGAYVSVYIGEDNILRAIEAVEKRLLEDCYRPVKTSAAYELDLDETDYDTDEVGYPENKDLIQIQETGDIWYGPFHGYETENEHIQ